MWRSEERLKYWLENGGRSARPGFASGLTQKLSLTLRLGPDAGAAREETLNIPATAVSLDEALGATATVVDGLDCLTSRAKSTAEPAAAWENGGNISNVRLLTDATPRELQLPDERLARIRQEKIQIAAASRSFPLKIRTAEVLELKHPYNEPPQLRDGSRFLIQNPAIQVSTSKLAELPHARTSVKIEEMPDSERAGFLREAEVLKGVRADGAELLAVFRHVPIEVISRLRFLAEKRAILYSISRDNRLSKTRVHDIGAVRDIESREIYLVPHRTRFQSVSLN